MGAFVQQSLDDVDVHLVAVSANCTVAVDIPMTVDEVIHIAVIPLASKRPKVIKTLIGLAFREARLFVI